MLIDEEAIELLKNQIAAELAITAEEKRKNDLAEQALRQRDLADKIRLRTALDTNEKVAGLAQQLPEVFLTIYGIREWQKEASKRLDRIEEILLIQLAGKGNGNKSRIEELKQELQQQHTEQLIVQETQNLNELENQLAQYGLNKPLDLINSIRKTKEKIKQLERRRSRLDAGDT